MAEIIKHQIESLQIGQSITVPGDTYDIRSICKSLPDKYRVIRATASSCCVIRIDENDEPIRRTVLDSIHNMRVFDVIRIQGDIQYIRTIVSRFNKKQNRAIKVNKINGVATLSENIMDRPSITADEYEQIEMDFEKKLEILKRRIQ